jgi:peptidoglycan hydrolase FlgJ
VNTTSDSGFFYDTQGLSDLRREARADREQALGPAARQFEAIFLQLILKSMRTSSLAAGAFDSKSASTYQDLYDKQLSVELSSSGGGEGGGLGLADLLVQQLKGGKLANADSLSQIQAATGAQDLVSGQAADKALAPGLAVANHEVPPTPMAAQSPGPIQARPRSLRLSDEAIPPSTPETRSQAATETEMSRTSKTTSVGSRFDSPQAFVKEMLRQAAPAAEQLGVPVRALVAQAALETGWGRHIMPKADGSSSFNLFGIKAGRSWSGEQVVKPTLEFSNGRFVKMREPFRAYGSFAESFQDYAELLSRSSRYQLALKNSAEPSRFFQELQRAGYATDPGYAAKLSSIYQGQFLNSSTVPAPAGVMDMKFKGA